MSKAVRLSTTPNSNKLKRNGALDTRFRLGARATPGPATSHTFLAAGCCAVPRSTDALTLQQHISASSNPQTPVPSPDT